MREEGKGKREKGRGILWLMLAAAVVVAVVVIVIVVGRRAPSLHGSSDRFAAASPVDTQPQSNETDERTATVGRAVPRAPQQSEEDETSSEDDSEEIAKPLTEEEKREAEEEKLVNGFDDLTDKWQEPSKGGVTMADIDNFAKSFRKIPKARQDECIHRALNLIPDENVMLLAGVLMDKTMDKEIVETVYSDVLNRDEDVKKPILQQIFKDKTHPCWADTAWILDVTGELPKK